MYWLTDLLTNNFSYFFQSSCNFHLFVNWFKSHFTSFFSLHGILFLSIAVSIVEYQCSWEVAFWKWTDRMLLQGWWKYSRGLFLYFCCVCLTAEIVCVVLFQCPNPNCILLIIFFQTRCITFMACFSSFVALYEPHFIVTACYELGTFFVSTLLLVSTLTIKLKTILQLWRSQIWVPAVPLSGNNLGQVVHTHVPCLCHHAVEFGTSQEAVMPCGWKGNCRSVVVLAVCHRLQWFIHVRAHGLSN